MDASRVDRIDEPYHKSQSVGLTEGKKEEQVRPRQEYVAAVWGNLRNNLSNIPIREPDGSITDLGEKHGGIKEV